MIDVITIETPELGDRSYVATDGTVAVVVDPQRDIDRITALASKLGARITHVLETHIHNDYVSGGLQLARECGATYVLSGAEPVSFTGERLPVSDGDQVKTGQLIVTALSSPGHTPHHMSYLLADASTGEVVTVFTGGCLLFGSAGRTDLMGDGHTQALSRAQWRSLHRLSVLDDEVAVHPTHGFGSFCASACEPALVSTIGRERSVNPGLLLDEETFIRTSIASFPEYPSYFSHMADLNLRGPAPIDLSCPSETDAPDLAGRVAEGEWVVDLRDRTCFAAGHLAGTVNVEAGNSFAVYLGWTLPWGTPITLVGDRPEQVAAAQRALARIGVDRPHVHVCHGLESLAESEALRSYPVSTFAELTEIWGADGGCFVIDVRSLDEWRSGHMPGALHIPFHELPARMEEVPTDRHVWVYCAGGFRASIAASILDAAGRSVTLVNDRWSNAGLFVA